MAIDRKEGSKDGSSHTPRRMLAKLNSLTIGSFRQSTDSEVSNSIDQPLRRMIIRWSLLVLTGRL